MVGDRKGVTVVTVAELELTFEIGAPQIVGSESGRQRCAGGAMSWPTETLDQAVAVQNGVNGALGGNADITGHLARTPMRQLEASTPAECRTHLYSAAGYRQYLASTCILYIST